MCGNLDMELIEGLVYSHKVIG